MKDITDVFSEVIDKYIDFYMTKEEFNRAWEKVTKEMSRRYKKRGKELCESKEEIEYTIKWFDIGKTKREVELEKEVENLKSKLEEYENEMVYLNTKIKNLKFKEKEYKKEIKNFSNMDKRLTKVEYSINRKNDEEIEKCARENRRFREYEEYANSYEGRKEWSDYVDSCFRRDAEIRREEEKLERLF